MPRIQKVTLKPVDPRARQMVWREVDSISFYDLEGSVDTAIQILQRVQEKYPGCKLSKQPIPYDDGDYLAVQQERPETDAELKRRLENMDRHAADQEARDRAEFKRLQKKFQKA